MVTQPSSKSNGDDAYDYEEMSYSYSLPTRDSYSHQRDSRAGQHGSKHVPMNKSGRHSKDHGRSSTSYKIEANQSSCSRTRSARRRTKQPKTMKRNLIRSSSPSSDMAPPQNKKSVEGFAAHSINSHYYGNRHVPKDDLNNIRYPCEEKMTKIVGTFQASTVDHVMNAVDMEPGTLNLALTKSTIVVNKQVVKGSSMSVKAVLNSMQQTELHLRENSVIPGIDEYDNYQRWQNGLNVLEIDEEFEYYSSSEEELEIEAQLEITEVEMTTVEEYILSCSDEHSERRQSSSSIHNLTDVSVAVRRASTSSESSSTVSTPSLSYSYSASSDEEEHEAKRDEQHIHEGSLQMGFTVEHYDAVVKGRHEVEASESSSVANSTVRNATATAVTTAARHTGTTQSIATTGITTTGITTTGITSTAASTAASTGIMTTEHGTNYSYTTNPQISYQELMCEDMASELSVASVASSNAGRSWADLALIDDTDGYTIEITYGTAECSVTGAEHVKQVETITEVESVAHVDTMTEVDHTIKTVYEGPTLEPSERYIAYDGSVEFPLLEERETIRAGVQACQVPIVNTPTKPKVLELGTATYPLIPELCVSESGDGSPPVYLEESIALGIHGQHNAYSVHSYQVPQVRTTSIATGMTIEQHVTTGNSYYYNNESASTELGPSVVYHHRGLAEVTTMDHSHSHTNGNKEVRESVQYGRPDKPAKMKQKRVCCDVRKTSESSSTLMSVQPLYNEGHFDEHRGSVATTQMTTVSSLRDAQFFNAPHQTHKVVESNYTTQQAEHQAETYYVSGPAGAIHVAGDQTTPRSPASPSSPIPAIFVTPPAVTPVAKAHTEVLFSAPGTPAYHETTGPSIDHVILHDESSLVRFETEKKEKNAWCNRSVKQPPIAEHISSYSYYSSEHEVIGRATDGTGSSLRSVGTRGYMMHA